jgi:hypothetical protein
VQLRSDVVLPSLFCFECDLVYKIIRWVALQRLVECVFNIDVGGLFFALFCTIFLMTVIAVRSIFPRLSWILLVQLDRRGWAMECVRAGGVASNPAVRVRAI